MAPKKNKTSNVKPQGQGATEIYGEETRQVSLKDSRQPKVWVVYAKLPRKYVAIAAVHAGLEPDECYEMLRGISRTEGCPGVERKIREMGVTKEEWPEVLPLYDEVKTSSEKLEPKPRAEDEIIGLEFTEADVLELMQKAGADFVALEIRAQQKLLSAQERELDTAKADLFLAEKSLMDTAQSISKGLWASSEAYRNWAGTMPNAEWDETRMKIVELKLRQDFPEVYTILESALLNKKQVEEAIKTTEDTLANLQA